MKVLIEVMVELHDGVDPVDWQENGDYGNLWGDPDVVDCELREVTVVSHINLESSILETY